MSTEQTMIRKRPKIPWWETKRDYGNREVDENQIIPTEQPLE
jgi:hypothetical protein